MLGERWSIYVLENGERVEVLGEVLDAVSEADALRAFLQVFPEESGRHLVASRD